MVHLPSAIIVLQFDCLIWNWALQCSFDQFVLIMHCLSHVDVNQLALSGPFYASSCIFCCFLAIAKFEWAQMSISYLEGGSSSIRALLCLPSANNKVPLLLGRHWLSLFVCAMQDNLFHQLLIECNCKQVNKTAVEAIAVTTGITLAAAQMSIFQSSLQLQQRVSHSDFTPF